MPTNPDAMTINHRLDIAGDLLFDDDNIRLVIDTDPRGTAEDAWNDAEAEYGKRIALIHAPHNRFGSTVKVSWHYSDPSAAQAIVRAFTAAGCTATWSGEAWNAVHVDLGAAQ